MVVWRRLRSTGSKVCTWGMEAPVQGLGRVLGSRERMKQSRSSSSGSIKEVAWVMNRGMEKGMTDMLGMTKVRCSVQGRCI
jgi:hypothetical protein